MNTETRALFFSFIFFRGKISRWTWSLLIKLCWLAMSSRVLGPTLRARDYRCTQLYLDLYRCWESKIRSSLLQRRDFTAWSYLHIPTAHKLSHKGKGNSRMQSWTWYGNIDTNKRGLHWNWSLSVWSEKVDMLVAEELRKKWRNSEASGLPSIPYACCCTLPGGLCP